MISGETSYISQLCKLKWYEWVVFHDEWTPLPDDVLRLSHYLGSSIDVGLVMIAVFLTDNGQVLHISTYRQLTQDEISKKMGSMPMNSSCPKFIKSRGLRFYLESWRS